MTWVGVLVSFFWPRYLILAKYPNLYCGHGLLYGHGIFHN